MQAVAIGPFTRPQTDTLLSAATRASVELQVFASFEDAGRELGTRHAAPGCIMASADERLASIVEWVRGRDGWFGVPVFALAHHPSERVFAEAFAAGADDAIVAHDAPGIQRRLVNLQHHDPAARPPATSGVALVASANQSKRRDIGRVLRQAGFAVSFAGDPRDLMAASTSQAVPTLVVATPSFPPMGGDAAVRTVRTAARDPHLPAIVISGAVGGGVSALDGLQLAGGTPSDDRGKLLFLAEEALRGAPANDQRASDRLHFNTICGFRMAGLLEPTYGLTHNLSREGLFIRTLDPPPRSAEVWLELRTFDGDTVHLRGTVVWRRQADQVGGTVPPGFGVQLDAAKSPPGDLARYVASYDNLLRHQGNVN